MAEAAVEEGTDSNSLSPAIYVKFHKTRTRHSWRVIILLLTVCAYEIC